MQSMFSSAEVPGDVRAESGDFDVAARQFQNVLQHKLIYSSHYSVYDTPASPELERTINNNKLVFEYNKI